MNRIAYLYNLSGLVEEVAPIEEFIELYRETFGKLPSEELINSYKLLISNSENKEIKEERDNDSYSYSDEYIGYDEEDDETF